MGPCNRWSPSRQPKEPIPKHCMNSLSGDENGLDAACLRTGDEAEFNALMQRHSEKLYRYFLRSLQNEAEAVDLTQETFVKVYAHRLTFNPKTRFSTWLYAIAANLVRDRFRWRSRHPQISIDALDEVTQLSHRDSLPSDAPQPNETLLQTERAEAVRTAIGTLPEELRQALLLAEYEGFSHAEIGKILGFSPKAVEMRIYRARQQLRTQLRSWLSKL